VYCTRTGWLVKFDLAGVRPEDVRLAVSGGRLLLSGIRRDWCIEDGCNYYRMEIAYSNFARGIELPVNLEAAELTTEFQEGMLLVRIKEPARE
jgi:HSP20 family protein